jgi:hypothetical protein
MFKSKVLFIVGAGASCEAKLPSGYELKLKIGEKLNFHFNSNPDQVPEGDQWIYDALQRHSHGPGELIKYIQARKQYYRAMHQAISIDNYLDAHQTDKYTILCGKLGIAKTILEAERTSLLYFDETRHETRNFANLEKTWYGAFQKLLMENVEKSNISNVFDNLSFITFNYDHCIEHLLVHAVTNYYGVSFNEVSSLVNQVVIRHPYGVVGVLPWQLQTQGRPVPFGRVENADLLGLAAQINTFTEQQQDDEKLTAIRQTVREAEVIVFLGFAFHERNMELISPGDSYRAKAA